MAAMSSRERRVIALGLIVAVATVGWLLLVEPIRERAETTAELIPARAQVLAKRRELLAREPTIRRELAETAQRLEAMKATLLTAATPPVAAAELLKIVKDAAGAARLEVRSERILPPAARGGLLEIPVEMTVSGGIRDLVTMLYALEEVRKTLTLQDVKIRVLNVSQPKELLTTVTVSGFILPKPASPKPASSPNQS